MSLSASHKGVELNLKKVIPGKSERRWIETRSLVKGKSIDLRLKGRRTEGRCS
jgi:hypothetical protein